MKIDVSSHYMGEAGQKYFEWQTAIGDIAKPAFDLACRIFAVLRKRRQLVAVARAQQA